MILPVYVYGQPVLRKRAEDLEQDYPDLENLIKNMYETMYASDGIGLAAPQIGKSIRLIVIDADPISDSFPECKDFKKVLINPYITNFGDETIGLEEGCLSLPGIHEKVERPTKITLKYLDEDFNEHIEELEGFAARVVQHEYDHLEGKLFVDHISAIRKQLINGKLRNIARGKINCGYRFKAVRK